MYFKLLLEKGYSLKSTPFISKVTHDVFNIPFYHIGWEIL